MTTLTTERPEDMNLGFAVGDKVRISSGWFENRIATVKSIDLQKRRIKVLVEDTSIDLDVSQLERLAD